MGLAQRLRTNAKPARAASPRATVSPSLAIHHASVLACTNEPSHSASCRPFRFPAIPAAAAQPGREPRPFEHLPAVQAGEPSLAAESVNELPSSRGPVQRPSLSTTSPHPAVKHAVSVHGTDLQPDLALPSTYQHAPQGFPRRHNDWRSAARTRRSAATEGLVSCNVRVRQPHAGILYGFLSVVVKIGFWSEEGPDVGRLQPHRSPSRLRR